MKLVRVAKAAMEEAAAAAKAADDAAEVEKVEIEKAKLRNALPDLADRLESSGILLTVGPILVKENLTSLEDWTALTREDLKLIDISDDDVQKIVQDGSD